MAPQKARFMGSTWGPSWADRTQVGPMLTPRILLSGTRWRQSEHWWFERSISGTTCYDVSNLKTNWHKPNISQCIKYQYRPDAKFPSQFYSNKLSSTQSELRRSIKNGILDKGSATTSLIYFEIKGKNPFKCKGKWHDISSHFKWVFMVGSNIHVHSPDKKLLYMENVILKAVLRRKLKRLFHLHNLQQNDISFGKNETYWNIVLFAKIPF